MRDGRTEAPRAFSPCPFCFPPYPPLGPPAELSLLLKPECAARWQTDPMPTGEDPSKRLPPWSRSWLRPRRVYDKRANWSSCSVRRGGVVWAVRHGRAATRIERYGTKQCKASSMRGWGRVTIDSKRGSRTVFSICATGAADGRIVVTAWWWPGRLWAKLERGSLHKGATHHRWLVCSSSTALHHDG